jgi:hypothetical protein
MVKNQIDRKFNFSAVGMTEILNHRTYTICKINQLTIVIRL